MKKFFKILKKIIKILRKIIKILLKIILRLILGIIVITVIILLIINNRTLKFYEFYDENYDFHRKFTMSKSFNIEDGTEIILSLNNGTFTENNIYKGEIDSKGIIKINLKKGIITFDGKNFEDIEIPGGYLEEHDTIKFKKLHFKDVKQGYKDGVIENFFEILRYFVDGEDIGYYSNGQISNKRIYVNGLENGPYISYYKNGQVEEEGIYKDGNENGTRTGYYENGDIKFKGNYINGIPNGTFTGYFEDGNLRYIYKFKNGKYDGSSIYHGNDGSYTDIKADDGVGTATVYDKNNDIIVEYGFITDELHNLVLDGKYIKHFEDGKITELNYKNGKYNGNQIGYYEDNSIRFSGNFENGLGIISYFDENGNLIGTGEREFTDYFKYGSIIKTYNLIIKNGLDISLYDNGQIKEISNYSDGKLNGIQKIYYENGNIRYSGEHKIEEIRNRSINKPEYLILSKFEYFDKNGNSIGTGEAFCSQKSGDFCTETKQIGNMLIRRREPSWNTELYEDIDGSRIIQNRISWYENGNLEYVQNYKNGELENIDHYYENGQIKEEGIYENGKKIGARTGYYEDGNMLEKGNYIDGNEDGYRVRYYENGQIYSEGNYDNGKRVGVWNRYLGDGSIGVSKNYSE